MAQVFLINMYNGQRKGVQNLIGSGICIVPVPNLGREDLNLTVAGGHGSGILN
jgi:hypothetical protein